MQVVAFHHEVGQLADLAVVVLGDANAASCPVHILFIAETLDKGLIIWIVVGLLEGSRIVEALNQQSLAFEVGVTQRPHDFVHAFAYGPSLNSIEQCSCHFFVFNDIEMGETHLFLARFLVGSPLEYAGNAPHHLAVFVGVIMDGVAHVVVNEVLTEDFLLVHIQGWREVGVALVEFQREVEEFLLLLFG